MTTSRARPPAQFPLATLATLAILGAGSNAAGQPHWSQFRGPGSRGIAPDDAALPVEFGPDQNMVWRSRVPAGLSSPCIWGDRVFLTGATEAPDQPLRLETLCLDRGTGAIRWRQAVTVNTVERYHRINSAATPTAAADAQRVYVSFGSFGLLCYDHDGVEVWRRELPTPKNMFGTAASPILAGDRLIFSRDTKEESWVEAIEPATGATIWRVDRTGFPSAWSTPVVWHPNGVDELLVYGAFRLVAYDLADGAERWSVPGLADEPCITPVTGDGMVFVSSYNMRTNPEVIGLPKFETLLADYDGNDNGTLDREEVQPNKSILSRLDADGEGDHPLRGFFRFLDKDRNGELDATEWQKMSAWLRSFAHANAVLAIRPGDGADRPAEIAWQHPHGVPEVPSPLYHNGRIYTVKNGGIASCLDARTGEVRFQERLGTRGPCYAAPVVGDGKIYSVSARGVVTVFEIGDTLRVLARNEIGERVMATPALAGGRIYLRTAEHLYAFGRS